MDTESNVVRIDEWTEAVSSFSSIGASLCSSVDLSEKVAAASRLVADNRIHDSTRSAFRDHADLSVNPLIFGILGIHEVQSEASDASAPCR